MACLPNALPIATPWPVITAVSTPFTVPSNCRPLQFCCDDDKLCRFCLPWCGAKHLCPHPCCSTKRQMPHHRLMLVVPKMKIVRPSFNFIPIIGFADNATNQPIINWWHTNCFTVFLDMVILAPASLAMLHLPPPCPQGGGHNKSLNNCCRGMTSTQSFLLVAPRRMM